LEKLRWKKVVGLFYPLAWLGLTTPFFHRTPFYFLPQTRFLQAQPPLGPRPLLLNKETFFFLSLPFETRGSAFFPHLSARIKTPPTHFSVLQKPPNTPQIFLAVRKTFWVVAPLSPFGLACPRKVRFVLDSFTSWPLRFRGLFEVSPPTFHLHLGRVFDTVSPDLPRGGLLIG